MDITAPVLLDIESPRMAGIVIKDGGRLVFSPEVASAKLTTGYVLISDNGTLEIGSEECKFTGNATITLTGERVVLKIFESTN